MQCVVCACVPESDIVGANADGGLDVTTGLNVNDGMVASSGQGLPHGDEVALVACAVPGCVGHCGAVHWAYTDTQRVIILISC
jgi:hypothetical protein